MVKHAQSPTRAGVADTSQEDWNALGFVLGALAADLLTDPPALAQR